ncbi:MULTISPECIES: MFS transporter [Bacillaceae]|uniref:MDR family MFS transporter n=1 Tax=Bacillaceae TaxID=186817 RepID=UPI0006F5834E|nr:MULTISPECIES: MFS transporter [Bacillaceae]KQL32436.1 MFS transporter [Psychrobacillus sp. FJAT-21963]MDF2068423.1 MFS transporter [Bacillus sp. Cr_A10]
MRIRDWDRALKVRLFGEFFSNLSFWMVFPFLAIYFADEFGTSMAGILLVVSQVFSVGANLIGGYCADRFGRRTMIFLSATVEGIAFILFAFANSPWMDSPIVSFIAFTIAGMAGSFYHPASQAIVADVVPEQARSSVFSVFYTSINISVVIGPIVGAVLFFQYRFALLLVAGIIFILVGIAIRFLTEETLPAEVREQLKDSGNNSWIQVVVNQIKAYGLIVKDKVFFLFVVAGILLAQTYMQLDMLIPVYMKDAIDVQVLGNLFGREWTVTGEGSFGILLSENGLLVVLFTVFVTKWMTKYPEKSVFFLSSIMYAVAMLIFPLTANFWVFLFAMAVFTLGELMTVGLQESFVSKLAPEDMRGQYFAAASLRYTIGRTIAPLVFPLVAWIGFTWTFVILAILAVLSGVIYLITFKEYNKRQNEISV